MTHNRITPPNIEAEDLENGTPTPEPAVHSPARRTYQAGRNVTFNQKLRLSLLAMTVVTLSVIVYLNDQLENEPSGNSELATNAAGGLFMFSWGVLSGMTQYLASLPGELYRGTQGFFRPQVLPRPENDNQTIFPLKGATCHGKFQGRSAGNVCEQDGETWYLKTIVSAPSSTKSGLASDIANVICFEEFNRQFAKNNIGIRVPKTRFFINTHYDGSDVMYIGSAKMDNLHFAGVLDEQKISNEQLGDKGMAKLLISKMFFYDMHSQNWAFDENGVVLIDVDGGGRIPDTTEKYLDQAADSLYWMLYKGDEQLKFRLMDIIDMKEIFENMRNITLPEHHDAFHMSEEIYSSLLDTYINACDATILAIQEKYPDLSPSDSNDALYENFIGHFNPNFFDMDGSRRYASSDSGDTVRAMFGF